jgi:hypothetical protein
MKLNKATDRGTWFAKAAAIEYGDEPSLLDDPTYPDSGEPDPNYGTEEWTKHKIEAAAKIAEMNGHPLGAYALRRLTTLSPEQLDEYVEDLVDESEELTNRTARTYYTKCLAQAIQSAASTYGHAFVPNAEDVIVVRPERQPAAPVPPNTLQAVKEILGKNGAEAEFVQAPDELVIRLGKWDYPASFKNRYWKARLLNERLGR